MGRVGNLLVLLFSFILCFATTLAANGIYVHGNSGPAWSQVGIRTSFENIWGVGGFAELNYLAPLTSIMPPTFDGILLLDGSASDVPDLQTWLDANEGALYTWVTNPSYTRSLYINSAGFGISLTSPTFGFTAVYEGAGVVMANNPSDPFFIGPFTPTVSTMSGNSYSHDKVAFSPVYSAVPILIDTATGNSVLSCISMGGRVILGGGLTDPYFHSPAIEAQNFYTNLIYWAANSPVMFSSSTTPSYSPSQSYSLSPTQSLSVTLSTSTSISLSSSATLSASRSTTLSVSSSRSFSVSISASTSVTPSRTASASVTLSRSSSGSATVTSSVSSSSSSSVTPSVTMSLSSSVTITGSVSISAPVSISATRSRSRSSAPSRSRSRSLSPDPSSTSAETLSSDPSPTRSVIPIPPSSSKEPNTPNPTPTVPFKTPGTVIKGPDGDDLGITYCSDPKFPYGCDKKCFASPLDCIPKGGGDGDDDGTVIVPVDIVVQTGFTVDVLVLDKTGLSVGEVKVPPGAFPEGTVLTVGSFIGETPEEQDEKKCGGTEAGTKRVSGIFDIKAYEPNGKRAQPKKDVSISMLVQLPPDLTIKPEDICIAFNQGNEGDEWGCQDSSSFHYKKLKNHTWEITNKFNHFTGFSALLGDPGASGDGCGSSSVTTYRWLACGFLAGAAVVVIVTCIAYYFHDKGKRISTFKKISSMSDSLRASSNNLAVP